MDKASGTQGRASFPRISILLSVAESARRLQATLDSLQAQRLPFAQVEVLLVPAALSERTDEIGRACAEQWPGQVYYPGQPGEDIGAVWNRALTLVKGDIVGFMHAGDRMTGGVLEAVCRAFRRKGKDIGMVRIRSVAAGTPAKSGLGRLLARNEQIDVRRGYDRAPLWCASSFFARETARRARFDARLGELAELKMMLEMLAEHPKYLQISREQYVARRMRGKKEEQSTEAYLQYLMLDVLENCRQRYGRIPNFVQYACVKNLPRHPWEKEAYAAPSPEREAALLEAALALVDDENICLQKAMNAEDKVALLQRKYKGPGILEKTPGGMALRFGDTTALHLEDLPVSLNFFHFHQDAIQVDVSFFYLPGPWDGAAQEVRVRGKRVDAEVYDREPSWYLLGQPVMFSRGMRFTVPYKDLGDGAEITFHTTEAGQHITRRNLRTGPFAPLTYQLRYSYAMHRGMKYRIQGGRITVKRCRLPGHVGSELLLGANILRQHGGLNPVLARMTAKLYRPWLKERVWLLLDRANKGGDNGEALFRYIQAQGFTRRQIYFVIEKDCEAYGKLRAEFPRILPYLGWKHKLLLLVPGETISAHITHTVHNIYGDRAYFYADLIAQSRYVYLKHGIIQNDTSSVLNLYRKNLALFITATRAEYQAMLTYPYGYDESVIKLTGLPRYDLLYRDEKKRVTIVPTWRKYLMEREGGEKQHWEHEETAEQSAYIRFYNGLLSHPALLDTAEALGYTVCFKPHPNADTAYMRQMMHADPRVVFLDFYEPYRKMFAETSLMVTDYSSVAFDFAYLEKPVIYCQFDEETFFSAVEGYVKGYFDYRRDGFGEVETTLEDTAQRIMEYMRADCRMKPQYLERVHGTFAFVDTENRKRVLDEILAFDEARKASL